MDRKTMEKAQRSENLYDSRPEIRRVTTPHKLQIFAGERVHFLGVLAVDGPSDADLCVEINQLIAFRAPIGALIEARQKLSAIDDVTKTLTSLSDAVRLRLSASRGLEDTKALLTELSLLSRGMAAAAKSWEELVKEVIAPIGLYMTCPPLTHEYEINFRTFRRGVVGDAEPAMVDVYLVVERATTRF